MALSKLAVRRLTRLCDEMEKLPPVARRHFDMEYYINPHAGKAHGVLGGRDLKAADLQTCGTTACALGWAATMPYFKRLGLRIEFSDMEDCIADAYGDDRIFDLETFGHDWNAIFGWTNSDQTPKQWAKRVRKYIKANSQKEA